MCECDEDTVEQLTVADEVFELYARFCDAADRGDREGILASFHPDGREIHHTFFEGSPEEFADYIMKLLSTRQCVRHYLGNQLLTVHGDDVSAETYIGVVFRFTKDGRLYDQIGKGRYLGHLQRRNGVWRILEQRTVIDMTTVVEVLEGNAEQPK